LRKTVENIGRGDEDIASVKRRLRQRMRRMLAAMPAGTAARKSQAACRALLELEEFKAAGVVMLYVPLSGELDTTRIGQAALRAGKSVLVPRVFWDRRFMVAVRSDWPEEELPANSHGLRQPSDATPWPADGIDLIIVPGLAFDRFGNRLGRGGGYYDRFLSQEGLRALTCGLAFAEQIVEALPIDKSDRRVELIVTDGGVISLDAP
jgi:5-formyltetrahydrofolate cyclo-ligase